MSHTLWLLLSANHGSHNSPLSIPLVISPGAPARSWRLSSQWPAYHQAKHIISAMYGVGSIVAWENKQYGIICELRSLNIYGLRWASIFEVRRFILPKTQIYINIFTLLRVYPLACPQYPTSQSSISSASISIIRPICQPSPIWN